MRESLNERELRMRESREREREPRDGRERAEREPRYTSCAACTCSVEVGAPRRTVERRAVPSLSCTRSVLAPSGVLFTGEVGEAHCLAQGEAGGENHWDKFLETPGAQAAARAELEALGVEMGGGL